MVFHRGKRKCLGNIGLYIDEVEITENPTMKYLRVIINIKLNWVSHITCVKNTIAKGIGFIKKARHFLNKSSLSNLYLYLIYCMKFGAVKSDLHCKTIKYSIIFLKIVIYAQFKFNLFQSKKIVSCACITFAIVYLCGYANIRTIGRFLPVQADSKLYIYICAEIFVQ